MDEYESEQQIDAPIEIDLDDDSPEMVVDDAPAWEADYPWLVNLARKLDADKLKEIAEQVIGDYENDLASRAEWEKKHAHWLDLYHQQDKPKRTPWAGASEESMPILTKIASAFSARASQQLFRSRELIRVIPQGAYVPGDEQRAARVQKYLNWQLFTKNYNYKNNKDRLLQALPVHGHFFTKTYFDPTTQTVKVDNVRPVDLVVPYGVSSRDIETIERKTHICYISYNQGKIYEQTGYYISCPEEGEEASEDNKIWLDSVNKAEGLKEGDKPTECRILEQHTLLNLGLDDQEKDDEGIKYPYIVWVCPVSRKVLRIAPRFEFTKVEQPPVQAMPIEMAPQMPELGIPEDPMADFTAPANEFEGMPPNMEMPMDMGMDMGMEMPMDIPEVEIVPNVTMWVADMTKPVEYFTSYPCLLNPDGFYAFGFGHLVGDINTAVNKIIRQAIDAGTLANTQSGFISASLGLRKGQTEMQMGKFITVPASVPNIKDGIYQVQSKGADQGLVQMMNTLMGEANQLGAVTDILMGETDKVQQPTTILALIDQGLVPFTAIMERVINAMGEELKKVYRLNALHLNKDDFYTLLDAEGNIQQQDVIAEDFKLDFDLLPVADPKMVTEQQKISKAQAEFGLIQQLATSGMIPPAYLRTAVRRQLEAMDVKNIDAIFPNEQVFAQMEAAQAQQPPPEAPEITQAKMKIQAEQMIAVAQMQLEREKMMMQIELEREKAMADIEIEKLKAGIKGQLEAEKNIMSENTKRMQFEGQMKMQKQQQAIDQSTAMDEQMLGAVNEGIATANSGGTTNLDEESIDNMVFGEPEEPVQLNGPAQSSFNSGTAI